MSQEKHSMIVFVVLFTITLLLSGTASALNCDAYEMDSFNDLIDYFRDTKRRNPEFIFVQPRNGQATVAARHPQYSRACFFFSIAPIIEHLGYAHWRQGSDYNTSFHYEIDGGTVLQEPLNVGYYGSVEHLMTSYIDADTLTFGQNHYWDDFLSATGTDLNRIDRGCNHYFVNGQEYGLCDPIAGTDIDTWMRYVSGGCGGGVHSDCSCSPDADCGIFWFLNDELQEIGMAGCNDARGFKPASSADNDDLRKIIKAFIDNDLPISISVNKGGHFMTLIGYADLDSSGLPKTAIAADPTYHEESPDYRYWIMPNIHLHNSWRSEGRCSINSIIVWNQHLDEACEPGGWADELDSAISDPDFKVCPLYNGWSLECTKRFYGIRVSCEDNRSVVGEWFRYKESPFIAEDSNIDCDKLIVNFADGEHTVESAVVRRYRYDSSAGSWERISTYYPDTLISNGIDIKGRGVFSRIIWDESWKDDYWIVAHDLSDTYTKRRTTIELTLNDEQKVVIEIAPPRTYGIEIECMNDRDITTYFAEADTEVFDNTNFFIDTSDRVCDEVRAEVRLGVIADVSEARIQRWGYKSWNGTWKWGQITSTWVPDLSFSTDDGLSGTTMRFIWDNVWPENYWLVADDVGADECEDRKTKFLFTMEDTEDREVEIIPDSVSAGCAANVISIDMVLPAGWSMISLPVMPDNPPVSSLFPEAVVVYKYQKGTGYVRVPAGENLEVGVGYWILLNSPQSYVIRGTAITEYTMPVADGWYMIGGCTDPARVFPHSCDIGVIYGYAPGTGYKRVTKPETLKPGKGYWILLIDVTDQATISVKTID